MKRYQRIFAGFAGLLVLGALAILFVLVATDPGDNIVLTSRGVKTAEDGNRLVTGILENRTDGIFSHVQLDIAFLDKAGNVVGTTVPRTRDLGAGETWSFAAPIPAQNAVRARLEDLTCSPGSCYMPTRFVLLAIE